jgi:hypothetical protein
METVTIATFSKESAADQVRGLLEQAQIHAETQHESTLEWLWFTAKPVVRWRLKVNTADFERATRLLQEWDKSDAVLREAVRCPECGSSRVQYPQFTRKFFLPNLIGLLATLGIVRREFYCEECHFTWPKDGQKRSRVRPHSAPYYFIEGISQPGK